MDRYRIDLVAGKTHSLVLTNEQGAPPSDPRPGQATGRCLAQAHRGRGGRHARVLLGRGRGHPQRRNRPCTGTGRGLATCASRPRPVSCKLPPTGPRALKTRPQHNVTGVGVTASRTPPYVAAAGARQMVAQGLTSWPEVASVFTSTPRLIRYGRRQASQSSPVQLAGGSKPGDGGQLDTAQTGHRQPAHSGWASPCIWGWPRVEAKEASSFPPSGLLAAALVAQQPPIDSISAALDD